MIHERTEDRPRSAPHLHGDFDRWDTDSRHALAIAAMSYRGRRYLELTRLEDGEPRGGPQISAEDVPTVANAIEVARSGGRLDWLTLTSDVALCAADGEMRFRPHGGRGRTRLIPNDKLDALEDALGWLLESAS